MYTTAAAFAMVVILAVGARGELITFSGEEGFSGFSIKGGRWDPVRRAVVASEREAVAESPAVAAGSRFDQIIVSWNAKTPPGAEIDVECRARVVDGAQPVWTEWFKLGTWNTLGCSRPRSSVSNQKNAHGRVDTDTVVLSGSANAVAVRFILRKSASGESPALRFASADLISSKARRPASSKTSRGSARRADAPTAWGTELSVPQLSQLSVEGGRSWCSPTCVAMVLGYWATRLSRPELSVDIGRAARAIHDEAWGGTGNWTFNTAFAGEFDGIRAFVTRLGGLEDVERWILRGVPVIASLDYNRLNRRKASKPMGHLVVVVGFTAEGDPVLNDPWAKPEKNEPVRKVFPRSDFVDAWLGPTGSLGTVYVIHPENLLH